MIAVFKFNFACKIIFVMSIGLFAESVFAENSDTATDVFATINGEVITQQTYQTALRAGGRQRFYHGKAPEMEIIEFRQQVGEKLIEERVLHQEALRRNIKPDSGWVDSEFAKIERQYSASPQWRDGGESLIKSIKGQLEERSRIKLFEDVLRQVDDPTESQLQQFYESAPETFTSPEQIKVTTVLLSVEPWQPKEAWDSATEQARTLHHAIDAGVDFDQLAQEYPLKDQSQLG